MVDLTAKPFNLDATAVDWVRRTIDALTLEEKIGQLFINLNVAFTPAYLDHILDTYHVGGMRYRGADAATVQAHIRYAQLQSKVPVGCEYRVFHRLWGYAASRSYSWMSPPSTSRHRTGPQAAPGAAGIGVCWPSPRCGRARL